MVAGVAANRILIEAGCDPLPALERAAWQGTAPLTRRTRPIAGVRFFVLGDAAGYVEPFTGEGMAWALLSGRAIAPLAARGIKRWDPAPARAWESQHRRLVRRRQRVCRALAVLLRYPTLAHTALRWTDRAPGVARLMIKRVNLSSANA